MAIVVAVMGLSCALRTPLSMLDTPKCFPEAPVNEACVFVDLNNGDDNNPGTKEAPVKTPHKGLEIAKDSSRSPWGVVKSVVVSKGSYLFNSSVNATNDNSLKLLKGQSIYGGYEPSLGWRRDVEAYVTYMENTSSAVTPDCGDIPCPTLIEIRESDVAVDGLTLQGTLNAASGRNAAIYVRGLQDAYITNIRIQNNKIRLGYNSDVGSGFAIGVRLEYAEATIEANTFSGGSGQRIVAVSCTKIRNTTVKSNTISMGSGNFAMYAISCGYTQIVVSDNTITLGSLSGANGELIAIRLLASTTATIANNTISGGTLNCTSGTCRMDGIRLEDSVATVEGNTISYGNAIGAGTRDRTGIYVVVGSKGGHHIKNNEVRLTGSNWSTAFGISYSNVSGAESSFVTNNKIYMHSSNITGDAAGIWNGGTINSLLTIQGNTVEGGAGTSAGGTYIIITIGHSGAAATVKENSIFVKGAPPNTGSFARSIHVGGPADVYNNYVEVFDSSASNSDGIFVSEPNCKIYNNIVVHNSSAATGNSKIGISLNASSGQVFNNTLLTFSGSGGGQTVGVLINSAGAAPDIRNNLIVQRGSMTTGYGIWEVQSASPVALRNNVIYNAATNTVNRPYFDFDNGCTTNGDGDGNNQTCTLAEMNALTNFSGNISVAPTFVDAANGNYRLAAGADNNLKFGGLDLSAIFTTDYDGVTRTAVNGGLSTNGGQGWSIGAWERD